MTHIIIPFLLALVVMSSSCRQGGEHPVSADTKAEFGDSRYLLSVEEVAALLHSPTPPLVVEISMPEKFAEGHLPGAINLWRPDYEDDVNYPYGGMRTPRDKMAHLLGSLGARTAELIVVYCTRGSADAARLTWLLRSYGHDNVVMMDGGKAGWQHAGYPLTKVFTRQRNPTGYHFTGPENTDHIAFIDEILLAISDTNTIIVDAREDYEYLGIPHISNNSVLRFKQGAFTHGAIPTAHHLNWSEAVDLHSDHTFKSVADLNHNLLRQGITPDKRIIVYCHSGVRSAHTTFVLTELLGYSDVKNYDGSWIEWSYFYAKDTMGMIQRHTSPEETETIYRDLMAAIQEVATD